MSVTKNVPLAVRALFMQPPFSQLVGEGMMAMYGNSNGTVFGTYRDGSRLKFDGFNADQGRAMLEPVVGPCTREQSNLQMDVEVNGVGFCLTLMGPPSSDGYTWAVVQRESVVPDGQHDIAARVDLNGGTLDALTSGQVQIDLGPASPEMEGAFRRGFHQAVAAVADALRHRELTAEELDAWVEGSGMRWRKDVTLSRQIVPPNI